jgi:hypothetical protein
MPDICPKSFKGSRQRQGCCASFDEVAAVEHRVSIIAPNAPQARLELERGGPLQSSAPDHGL